MRAADFFPFTAGGPVPYCLDMSNTTDLGATGSNVHANISFCKSTVIYGRKGSVTQAWAMGWLAGMGCSGYHMPRYLSDEARAAYRDGKDEGQAARAVAS